MEEQGKIKKKRKISLITVFLWLFLIVIMSIITIGSIRNQNAIENSVDKVTIKLDMSQIDDEILEVYASKIENSKFIEIKNPKVKFLGKEDKIYVYELEKVPTEDIKLYMMYFDYYENGNLLQSEIRYGEFAYYKEIKVEELQPEYLFEVRGEKIEVNIQNVFQGDYPLEIIPYNYELENISNPGNIADLAMFQPFIQVSEENKNIRYIGVRTSKAKSFIIISEADIYEGETLLKYLDGAYIKDLTESNEYFFNGGKKEATIVNLKIEGATDEEIEELMSKDIYIAYVYSRLYLTQLNETERVLDLENHQIKLFFNTIIPSHISLLMTELYTPFSCYQTFLEKKGELISYNKVVDMSGLEQSDTYDEFNIVLKRIPDEEYRNANANTYATEQIKWIDKNTGKAQIILGNTAFFKEYSGISFLLGEEAIYEQKLDENFVLSSEYENNEEWKIVDHISLELNDFEHFEEITKLFQQNTNLKYIYVKDINMIFWKYKISSFAVQGEPINVYYKNYEVINSKQEILNSHKYSRLNTSSIPLSVDPMDDVGVNNWWYLEVKLKSPQLKFYHTEERKITLKKFDRDGNYYIGLFEDDILSKIEKLEVINGSGSIQINIENYDETKQYTICEVSEQGNKVTNELYPVRFSSNYDIRNAEISSDTKIVSSVKSGVVHAYDDDYTQVKSRAPIEESTGTGEEDYVDNMLSVTDIYLADVTIGEEIKYKVTYEADEGGKLEGETEEYVKAGDTSQNIPTPVPEEGYEFDKWIIVEDGEEIEVDPSTYVPTKDVTFIAKFKEIQKIVDVDTSDIQVWVYAVILTVAVIGIVVVLVVRKKVKPKENK